MREKQYDLKKLGYPVKIIFQNGEVPIKDICHAMVMWSDNTTIRVGSAEGQNEKKAILEGLKDIISDILDNKNNDDEYLKKCLDEIESQETEWKKFMTTIFFLLNSFSSSLFKEICKKQPLYSSIVTAITSNEDRVDYKDIFKNNVDIIRMIIKDELTNEEIIEKLDEIYIEN